MFNNQHSNMATVLLLTLNGLCFSDGFVFPVIIFPSFNQLNNVDHIVSNNVDHILNYCSIIVCMYVFLGNSSLIEVKK